MYVGYATGRLEDQSRTNWAGTGPRPLRWSAWYPAKSATQPPDHSGPFLLGRLEDGAPIDSGPLPVVLLSHGTGGIAESLGWLARSLAVEGYVVLAANHHGNTGGDYLPEGFICWWERSRDLSLLLTELSQVPPFAGCLDLGRVSALGFSLGGATVLAMLGARYSMADFQGWMAETPGASDGPREFPDLAGRVPALLRDAPVFRRSWEGQGADFSDPRIRGAVAIAAAPPVRAFRPGSVAAIDRPVTLLTGEADTEAPTEQCSAWLRALNPGFRQVSMGEAVGHYSFVGRPAPGAGRSMPFLFTDAPGLCRAEVQARTAGAVLEALG